MPRMYTLESELALALFRFSYGRLSVAQAEKKAKEVAPYYDMNNKALCHKGVEWYAQQLLAVI